MTQLLGAIEAGGTKFVVAVADAKNPEKVLARASFPTRKPEETLADVQDWFAQYDDLVAIGIAAFGPIDVNEQSDTYGYVLQTPKPSWTNFDFLGAMKTWRDVPYFWTTDVNGAGWAEFVSGAAKAVDNALYLTVGTGIGAGIIQNGELLSGFGHPEAGHIFVRQHPKDTYSGRCVYHGNQCLEGVAAGPAIEERWGISAKDLPDDHLAWDIEADYLAQAAVNYTMILRPEKIIFGGGVPHRSVLLPLIREKFVDKLADYVTVPAVEDYIVSVAHGDDAGVIGGFYLAKSLLD